MAAPFALACAGAPAIAHDGKQPGTNVAAAKSVEGAPSAQHGFLHNVIGIRVGTRQPACKIDRRIEMRKGLRLEPSAPVIHRGECRLGLRVTDSMTMREGILFPPSARHAALGTKKQHPG